MQADSIHRPNYKADAQTTKINYTWWLVGVEVTSVVIL